MWSETVGLLGHDQYETKKSVLVLHTAVWILILVLKVWCCVVKHGLRHARGHNNLEGHSNF